MLDIARGISFIAIFQCADSREFSMIAQLQRSLKNSSNGKEKGSEVYNYCCVAVNLCQPITLRKKKSFCEMRKVSGDSLIELGLESSCPVEIASETNRKVA